MTAPRIVVLGSANMDLVVMVEAMPRPGETVTGRRYLAVTGGKGLNQAIAAARAGGDVAMIGAVGDDPFGAEIREVLAGAAVDAANVTVSAAPTGTAHITVDDEGENQIVVVAGANTTVTSLADAHRTAISERDILLLQLELPLSVVMEAASWARQAGVRTMLTPAPVVDLPDELLAAIDLLVPNEHEAAGLTGIDDPIDAARKLRSRGCRAVVVTLGADGCAYVDADGVTRVEGRPVTAVDTTAAGDTFAGCLAVALEEGRPVRDALRWATTAASLSVQTVGASSSMPPRSRIDAADQR
jgi:ribokinase